MLDLAQRELITQAHCFTAEKEQRLLDMQYAERDRPFHHLKPRLFIDGDKWCCLYGENLQDGVAGFGESPSSASYAFDSEFYKKIPSKISASGKGGGGREGIREESKRLRSE